MMLSDADRKAERDRLLQETLVELRILMEGEVLCKECASWAGNTRKWRLRHALYSLIHWGELLATAGSQLPFPGTTVWVNRDGRLVESVVYGYVIERGCVRMLNDTGFWPDIKNSSEWSLEKP